MKRYLGWFLVGIIVLFAPGGGWAERLKEPVQMTADKINYYGEQEIIILEGRVVIERGNARLDADKVIYNLKTNFVIAEGHVILREGEDILRCSRIEFDLDTKKGVVYDARAFLKKKNFHITGSKAEKLGENRYKIYDATLTSCDERVPSWKFTCKELEVETEGYATAWWPGFRVKEVPVFYFPWAKFPVKRERQSGFLFPGFAYSNQYGPQITIPYYWVIAPNQDATFYFTRHGDSRGRGFKGGIEYRYAWSTKSYGQIQTFHLYDQLEERHRWALFFDHHQLFPGGYNLLADVNWVSDKDYPVDFDEDMPDEALIDARSRNQLESLLYLSKDWRWGMAGVEFSYIRDLTVEDNSATLQRLPEARFEVFERPLFKTPFYWQFEATGTHFWREEGLRGGRIDLYPQVSLPLAPFGFLRFRPWAAYRETIYFPREEEGEEMDDTMSRELWEAGATLSTTLARVFYLSPDRTLRHSIEPALIYHYIPDVDQEDNPYFDALDRIEKQSLLTFQLTQWLRERERDEEGRFHYRDLLFLRISQGYDFSPGLTYEERLKNLELEGRLWPTPWLSLRGDMAYNYHEERVDICNISVGVKDNRGDSFHVDYRHSWEELEEVNFSTTIRVIDPLDLLFAYRYNLLDDVRIETMYGIRFRHQCWEILFKAYDINRSPDGLRDKEFKVMLEVTLRGIGTYRF